MDYGDFDYINKLYQININHGTPVRRSGTFPGSGVVWEARGMWIWIRWVGQDKPEGPFYPPAALLEYGHAAIKEPSLFDF